VLGAAALCALMSEVLVLLGGVEAVADGVWLLMLLWSAVVELWLPTPLELAAWSGVRLDGGVDCAVVLASDEATGAVALLLPIAPEVLEGCCELALWSEVMAPDVPPIAVCELPWFSAADEPLGQVSASFSTLATLITVAESAWAVVVLLLLCAGASATMMVT
jgi:hypothetical protein